MCMKVRVSIFLELDIYYIQGIKVEQSIAVRWPIVDT